MFSNVKFSKVELSDTSSIGDFLSGFNTYPLRNNTMYLVHSHKDDAYDMVLDLDGNRYYHGPVYNKDNLEKFFKADTELLEDTAYPTLVNLDRSQGSFQLTAGTNYTCTVYDNAYFNLPIITPNNNGEFEDTGDIRVELAYNKGIVDIGTKWKTTSVPINSMGIYFITYRWSMYLKNWVASIELISD